MSRLPTWLGYVATVLLEVATTAGLWALFPHFPIGQYPIPYVLLTMAIAYLFTEGPAILSVILGWFLFTYFFVPPMGIQWPIADSVGGWAQQVALLLGVTVVAAAMIQARRSTRRIQQLADEAVGLNASLMDEIHEREAAEEEIRKLNAVLEERVADRTSELQSVVAALETEVAQRKSAEVKSRQLLEMAPDGIIIADRQGTITFANDQAARLFGYEREDLAGMGVEELIPERYRDKHITHRSGYAEDPRTRPMGVGLELYGLRKDGSEFSVEIALSPTWTDSELTVTAIIRDVTERRRTEERVKRLNRDLELRAADLENANRELEAFSYSVSHDLRAPLRAIDGFSNTLLKNYLSSLDERGQDYLQRVRAAAQRMGQLIDDILGLSRASRAEMHVRGVDISATAQEIISELRNSHPDRNVEISVEQGMTARADPHLLRIALDNLLSNAWKFTANREVGRIEMGTSTSDGELVFCVKDNGAGFDPAYADKLFSPFQRLHSESEFPGTGIGLALVQRIIRRHGGRIWAEGAVDEGATFCFTLATGT